MRVVLVFVDMLRRDLVYSEKQFKNNEIANLLRGLGGTIFTNMWTPAPDTPRSLAVYYTGENPDNNGCDRRYKWPRYFLNKELGNIFQYVKKDTIRCFSNPNEREIGLFPSELYCSQVTHNEDLDLSGYLEKQKQLNEYLDVICLPDLHWANDDLRYDERKIEKILKPVAESLQLVLNHYCKNDVDHIIIFSDHGFKYAHQLKQEEESKFLNADRSNVYFQHYQKNTNINVNQRLGSITGFRDFFYKLISGKVDYSSFYRDKVYIEDFLSTGDAGVGSRPNIWARVDNLGYTAFQFSEIALLDSPDTSLEFQRFCDDPANWTSFASLSMELRLVARNRKLLTEKTTYTNGLIRQSSFFSKITKLYRSLRKALFQS